MSMDNAWSSTLQQWLQLLEEASEQGQRRTQAAEPWAAHRQEAGGLTKRYFFSVTLSRQKRRKLRVS